MLRNWLLVLTVFMAFVLVAAACAVVVAFTGVFWLGAPPFGASSDSWIGAEAVPTGPELESVASLPIDASGEGTIEGLPTGAATITEDLGTFELVLDPAPSGLPSRTTLDVEIDHSTKVYRDGRDMGDPLAAMSGDNGPFDADPSAAATAVVRFRIEDGRVFAVRLDLSDNWSGDLEP